MLIGILSDTHDHLTHVRQAVDIFAARGVERIYHAGDIVSAATVALFEQKGLRVVLGNNDGERRLLPLKVEQIGGQLGREVLEDTCPEGKIALYHGTVPALLQALIGCGQYRLVISGHTHRVMDRRAGSTRVLNPGTAHGFDGQATIMIYDTTADQVEVITL